MKKILKNIIPVLFIMGLLSCQEDIQEPVNINESISETDSTTNRIELPGLRDGLPTGGTSRP